jgi:hypothetical protein
MTIALVDAFIDPNITLTLRITPATFICNPVTFKWWN